LLPDAPTRTRSTGEPIDPTPHAVTTHPGDVCGGVHFDLIAPDTVTFVLRAPFKPYVSLVGDFNDWNTRTHRMVTDGQGLWWITLAAPGATRYGYYVAIDDQAHVWVGDPYARELRWEGDAPWAYLPAGRPVPFVWQDEAWQTPPLRDLVIYELCVRDFAGEWRENQPVLGTFQRMLDHVDYLAKLGVNAVEIMPIQAFPGDSSWGYNPVFFFAPAQSYGTPEEFKQLVDACHQAGIAVILDVALNHAWGEHPYYRIYPPMFSPQGDWLTDWNPYFHHTPQAVNMWGGVDWDHFAPVTTRYFQDVIRYWLREFHVDGFRFDWVCGVDYDSEAPLRAGFDPYHGISAIGWAARQEKPDCILIGEFWELEGTNPAKNSPKLVAETPLDACWNGNFHHVLENVLNQRWQWEREEIQWALGGFREQGFTTATQVVNFTCSHDEVRPEHEVKYYSFAHIDRPAGMTLTELALRKAQVGLVALFAAPGVPMIYAGQEYGEDAPRTIDFCPLNWDKLHQRPHQAHLAMVTRLIAARRSYAALRSDHVYFEPDDFVATQVIRLRRWDDSGTNVVAALNFGPVTRRVTLDLPGGGAWCNVVSGRIYHLSGGLNAFEVQPWQGILLCPLYARGARQA
jgi:1,4-alpha-glucan branching enzyme